LTRRRQLDGGDWRFPRRETIPTTMQSPLAKDADGRTALHHAAIADDTELMRRLLEASADLNAKDDGDWTPLHVAASAGRAQVVEVLLLRGIDVDASTSAGGSALTYAASKGHTAIAASLLQAKADVKHADRAGSTPIHLAAARGHCDVLAMLLASPGASIAIELRDKSGCTALHVAAVEMQVKATIFLCSSYTLLHTSSEQPCVRKQRRWARRPSMQNPP